MKRIYLDYAAATPVDPTVLAEMQPYFSEKYFNPSALYAEAREAKQSLEAARAKVASLIGAKPSEIIFTAGGTESANLAIHGVMKHYAYGEVLYSAIEHDAVRKAVLPYTSASCPVDSTGRVHIQEIENRVSDKTVLISIMYANNEIGSVQPISEITKLITKIRKDRRTRGIALPLLLHTDACQAPNYLDIHVARLGVDLMTLNGGKIYGPKQSGVLYVRAGVRLQPQVYGGGQEFGLRSGTENVAFAVGFAQALEQAIEKRHDQAKKAQELSSYFIEQLREKFVAQLNGHTKLRLPNNVHVTIEGTDNERVLFSLDEQGVMAASGSACSASKEEVSHVLSAIGLSDEQSQSSLRFSIGKNTTMDELDSTLEALSVALKA